MIKYTIRAAEKNYALFAFVYAILVFIPFCSLLYGWVPLLYRFLYVCATTIVFSLFVIPGFFITKQFWFAIIYMAVVIINSMNGDIFADDNRYDGFIMLMSACIGYYLVTQNDDKTRGWIVIMVFLTMIIQTITSYGIGRAIPGGLRELLNSMYRDERIVDWNYLFKAGLLSYETIHAIPFFIPPVVMWLRNKNLKNSWKVFLWITLICFVILISIYEATTVQLLGVFTLATSFLIHRIDKKKSMRRLITLAIIFLPFIFSYKLQITTLQTIERVTSGELSKKSGDVARDLGGTGESDASVRMDLYSSSFQEFSKSPLVGTDDSWNIGNHSAIIDRLGSLGLIGTIPYLLFVFAMIRFCNSLLPPNVNKLYYFLSVFAFIIILLLKNMHKIEVWLGIAVIVPALLTISENKMTKKV